MDITTPTITKEMEPHIKQKYHFAASSFARMYGPDKVTTEMLSFCSEWSLTEEKAPLDCLNNVDRYFRELWNHKC